MTRILVHVEGQTEEEFVNEVLAEHLYGVGYSVVSARLVGGPRVRKRRGGICSWPVVRDGIYKHLSGDEDALATTIVDFYALPSGGATGWPGRDSCTHLPLEGKAEHIAQSLVADLAGICGQNIANRFIPFVAMHEFEGLLFSDPHRMAMGMGANELAADFEAIRNSFETPEHINDSYETAPSKRILNLLPGYSKVLYGNLAALEVSLLRMREECPIFSAWISTLEARAA